MPDEPESAPEDGMTLPSVPQSVASIRRYAVETSGARGYGGDRDTLALLVSELATNALIHGCGQIRVRLVGLRGRLRVEVSDESTTMPARRASGDDAEGGRGIALVAALASAWGAEPRPGGKIVWFELAA